MCNLFYNKYLFVLFWYVHCAVKCLSKSVYTCILQCMLWLYALCCFIFMVTGGFSFVGLLVDACALFQCVLWSYCCVFWCGLSTLAHSLYCHCSGFWSLSWWLQRWMQGTLLNNWDELIVTKNVLPFTLCMQVIAKDESHHRIYKIVPSWCNQSWSFVHSYVKRNFWSRIFLKEFLKSYVKRLVTPICTMFCSLYTS